MKLYFKDRVFSHICLIMQMTNHTYSAVLGWHVTNTITTFVYSVWTYIWYQIAAYIKLCYDLCDSFLESRYNNKVIVIKCRCHESEYRDQVNKLINWCGENNLELNVSKTKEMIVDFRRKKSPLSPLLINGKTVETDLKRP